MLLAINSPRLREAPDVEGVSAAAMLLGIGAFKVFLLAYEHWYGERPAERLVERPFMHFLKTQICPDYVRHFTRLVRLQAERGRLDRTEYGLAAPPPETMTRTQLRNCTLALYAGMFAAIFFLVPALHGV